jgi:hypothetical protein
MLLRRTIDEHDPGPLLEREKSMANEELLSVINKNNRGWKKYQPFFCFVYYSKDMTIAIVCQFMLGTAASSGKLLLERELKLLGSK